MPRSSATLAGRIRSIRDLGKIIFSHIEDASGQIQLYLRQDDLGDTASGPVQRGLRSG